MSTINGKACVANGRNLLLDTDFNNLDLWYANRFWTKQPDRYNGLAVMQTTGIWNGISQYVKVKTGDVYTFSLYARYTSGTGTGNIYWRLNGNPETGYASAQVSDSYKFVNLSENWQRVSATTTITADGYIRPRIERPDNNDNALQIAGMKLERGNKATDWTPAPVDKVFSDGRQVYGRNYYQQNTPAQIVVLPNATYKPSFTRPNADCPNGFMLTGAQDATGTVRFNNVITGNGLWTVSFWMRGNQGSAQNLTLDACDLSPVKLFTSEDDTWQKYIYTVNITNYSSGVYNFVDFSSITWAWFLIKDFKVEKGNKATPWSPAPEDYGVV